MCDSDCVCDKFGLDYYGVLSLKRECSDLDIQKAFKRLALNHHPKRKNSHGNLAAFSLIAEAYDVLSDPLKKAVFDQYGEEGLKRGVPGPEGFIEPYVYHGEPMRTFRDFFGTENPYADLLDYLTRPHPLFEFPEGRGIKRKEEPVIVNLQLTLEEVTLYETSVRKDKVHSSVGRDERIKPFLCNKSMQSIDTKLAGTKYRRYPTKFYANKFEHLATVLATVVETNFFISMVKMYARSSSSSVQVFYGGMKKMKLQRRVFVGPDKVETELKEEVLTIPIKPGIPTGTEIVFPEMGDQGPAKIPADVIFVVEDRPHDAFRRDDSDLHMTLDVFLREALTGTVVTVNTIDDRVLRVAITSIITPEYRKIIEGEGLPLPENPKERGNLILSFNIEFPVYLSIDSKDYVFKALESQATSDAIENAEYVHRYGVQRSKMWNML